MPGTFSGSLHDYVTNLHTSIFAVGEAGALEGKRYSYAQKVDVRERAEFEGATYESSGYSQHGNVTTVGICPLASRSLNLPDGTEDVTKGCVARVKGNESVGMSNSPTSNYILRHERGGTVD